MLMREWVYLALVDAIKKNTYSNLYLKDHLHEVDPKDRALASNIFYGTLQNYDLCHYAWSRFTDGKVGSKTGILLTMSCYQLLFLNKVPAYAVINDANKIAVHQLRGQKGLVNALLRKVKDVPLQLPNDPIEALALKTSMPKWLIQLWIKQYSPQQAFKFAHASLEALPVVVRVNPLKWSIDEAKQCPRLRTFGQDYSEQTGLFIYTGNQIGHDVLYQEGKISIQDPGSFEIAKWANVKANQTVLDCCAAPGTKTMAMAEMAKDQAKIVAQDVHEHRVRLIQQDAKRLNLTNIQARQQDSTIVSDPLVQYDVVLCDVPCSGFGILSRKPDLKLRLDPKTIDSLLPIQKELLIAAAKQTKVNGTLIYSTCTLDKKENEKQVESFLADHPNFVLEKDITIEPTSQNGGFYIAKLIKKEQ